MKYNYLDDHRLHRRLVRFLKLLSVLVLVGVVVGVIVIIDALRENKPTTEVTSRPTESAIVARDNVIRSAYFQFQAPKNWIEVANESKAPNFVYREMSGQLIRRELRIFVNSDISLPKASRVLPIAPNGDRLTVGSVSEHCSTDKRFTAGPDNPVVMAWQGVMMTCDPDTVSTYAVVVGQVGPTPSVTLTRPDGTKASYKIIYHDFTASPSTNSLVGILQSFQTR